MYSDLKKYIKKAVVCVYLLLSSFIVTGGELGRAYSFVQPSLSIPGRTGRGGGVSPNTSEPGQSKGGGQGGGQSC